MRNPIQKAFDPIKADPDLIHRTREALSDGQTMVENRQTYRRSPFMRGLAAAVAIVMLAGACVVAGLLVLNTPVAAVSLDINPSITIQVNALRKVISVTGLNAEGNKLVTADLINKPVQAVVARLITDAAKAGYLADDGSTIINITTATDRAGLKDKISTETGKAAEAALKNAEKKAVIFQDYSGFERVEQARKMGITPGRLNLIEKLAELDGATSIQNYDNDNVTNYASMSNQEIMKKVVAIRKEQRDQEKAARKAEKGNSPTGTAADLTDLSAEETALLQMEQALASAAQNAQQNAAQNAAQDAQQNQGKGNNGQGKK